MKIISVEELTIQERVEIYEEDKCPECHKELKINYFDPDGGSWECTDCNIEYWTVF
jgi:ribosomal protein L37AE/L43A